tara:strand:- start:972 stop:1577 length:606 start_codon:yes stop_codon:yes gene_type:complete
MDKKELDSAIKYLSNDSDLKSLIRQYGKLDFGHSETPFKSLIKYIIYQQLSIASAKAIYTRFLKLFNNKPTPINVNNLDLTILKDIGLSRQKIVYICDIADFFINNDIDFDSLTNKEIYSQLIQIKGIGPWTIDMFLMFTLNKMNIMPVGDLGIKKGFKILYDLDNLPSDEFMLEKAKKWDPYQSIASLYLWKIVDGDVVF